jgi:UDP-glucose 4-epimerase
MMRVWVLGAGGMLGAAVTKMLSRQDTTIYRYTESFDWTNPDRLRMQFSQAVGGFLEGLPDGGHWVIYWAAGVGSMGSTRAGLAGETAALQTLLTLLREQLPRCGTSGTIAFASSAGALYAGCTDFEITETSLVTAVSDYAEAKLAQEQVLEAFVSDVDGVKLLVARFSTLFGPGQAFGKRQGLLSHIARCALRNQPVEIFVPMDTSRDYLFADDAACDFIESSMALRNYDGKSLMKIIAAERSVTISEIVSTFNRLIKKRLRVVCNRNSISSLYAPRVAYRSTTPLPPRTGFSRHTLLEGAATLLRAERMAYIVGPYKG